MEPYTTFLTSDKCSPDFIETVTQDDEVIGIAVTHNSNWQCSERDDGVDDVFSFKYVVLCEENITGNGEGLVAVHLRDYSDPCQPVVTLAHAAGCRAETETETEEVVTPITETEEVVTSVDLMWSVTDGGATAITSAAIAAIATFVVV